MLKILRTTLRQHCDLANRKMVLRLPHEILQTSVRRQVYGCRKADVKRAFVSEFLKILFLELGTRSNSLCTEHKCRLCESDTLVKISTISSGAKPCNALYTIVHE